MREQSTLLLEAIAQSTTSGTAAQPHLAEVAAELLRLRARVDALESAQAAPLRTRLVRGLFARRATA